MSTLSLVKTIAKNIKYQELSELIGKTVTINSIDTLPDDIRRDLGLFANTRWLTKDEKFLRGAIAKYGLIDLDYLYYGELPPTAESGIKLIRRFHLVQENSENENDEFSRELTGLGQSFLEDMGEELNSNQVYFKAFLRTEHPKGLEGLQTFFSFKQGQAFPDDYFPREFVVEDAALSNTSHIWMFRHFYW
jgi:hypothetical protein